MNTGATQTPKPNVSESSRITRWRQTADHFGVVFVIRAIVALVLAKLVGPSAKLTQAVRPDERLDNRRFDATYGTDTAGRVGGAEEGTAEEFAAASAGYEATTRQQVAGLIERLDPAAGTVLFDYGAGKGKAVFAAAMSGRFSRVVGVELGGERIGAARRNHEIIRPHLPPDVEIEWRHESATQTDLPTDAPIAVFMFNPFDETVMTPVLDSLAAAERRNRMGISIGYVHPRHFDVFDAHPDIVEIDRVDLEPWALSYRLYRIEPAD